jgi:plastocyanin
MAAIIIATWPENDGEHVFSTVSSSTFSFTKAQVDAKAYVDINGSGLDPLMLTIRSGTTVIWTNQAMIGCEIVSGSLLDVSGVTSFRSPYLGFGQTFSYTFNTPGQIQYYCSAQPGRAGVINVQY